MRFSAVSLASFLAVGSHYTAYCPFTNAFSVGGGNINLPVHHQIRNKRAQNEISFVTGNKLPFTLYATEETAPAEAVVEEAAANGEKATEEKEEEKEEPLVLCEVPPASHSITTTNDGPASAPVTTLTVHLGKPGHPEPLVFQTGKIGRQAAGAVTLTRGDTILYNTASRDSKPKETIDFLPLSVEHQERFSSAGLTSGSYNRRDGRPAEHEVLTCRLIDRPLRPLIADGWRHETQILSWVLSYDGERSCDPLAITASAAALYISDVPIEKPVAAANVGYIDGQFVLNPTNEQMEKSSLHLTVAGTKDAVLMIEGAADFLPEDVMIEAVSFGHEAIQTICVALEEFGEAVGKEKNYSTLIKPAEGLQEEVNDTLGEKVEQLWNEEGKKDDLSTSMSALSKEAWSLFEEKYPENKNEVMKCYKNLLSKKMYQKAKSTGVRCDGRKLDEVRQIDIETTMLPMVHGSALFTRGETQAIATTTLGDSGMKQKIDKLDGLWKKRFYLQYTFPPSCVGETGRVGAPGRREIGHGNLAERALEAIIPSEADFPYSIRVESLITESNGSSSMASVCGGCLALMDAGVPIKNPVAGIAMGLLLDDTHTVSDDDAVIVSDILGTEDGLGTMDFKVAGDREGITTFQLDIKCEGLTIETMARALEQAKQGRLHILDKMDAALEAPRDELPNTVPRIQKFNISPDSIGKVIGPGGKQIRAIIEDFELTNMDVGEDGEIQVSSLDREKLKKAEEFVQELVKSAGGGRGGRGGGGGRGPKVPYAGPPAVEGENYKAKITGIHQFGVFLEILPGAEDGSYPGLEGLCHVSELHTERVRNCEGFVNGMNVETLDVKYLGKNHKGQLQLSRKAVMEEKRNGGKKSKPTPKQEEMSSEEVDVIAQAIEGIKNL
jgi:polyribonucleotide nucleotidyltransferase